MNAAATNASMSNVANVGTNMTILVGSKFATDQSMYRNLYASPSLVKNSASEFSLHLGVSMSLATDICRSLLICVYREPGDA